MYIPRPHHRSLVVSGIHKKHMWLLMMHKSKYQHLLTLILDPWPSRVCRMSSASSRPLIAVRAYYTHPHIYIRLIARGRPPSQTYSIRSKFHFKKKKERILTTDDAPRAEELVGRTPTLLAGKTTDSNLFVRVKVHSFTRISKVGNARQASAPTHPVSTCPPDHRQFARWGALGAYIMWSC